MLTTTLKCQYGGLKKSQNSNANVQNDSTSHLKPPIPGIVPFAHYSLCDACQLH